MSNLAIFSNESFGNVRTTMIDGNPWFVARDVCDCLGLDSSNISKLLDEDEKGSYTVRTLGGDQRMLTINESGLYSLVLRSRKPEAKAFKRWITHEVLPSIRKTGGYGQTTLPNFNNPVEAARAWADAKEAEMLAQAKVVELAPKADTYDNVVADRKCTLTDFARKLNGVNTVAIKRSLLNNDIMYKMGDRYKVYSKYRDTHFEEKYDAFRGVTQIIVLDKGKQLLTKLYKEHKLIMKGQK
jgi:prophage antirepressor-like protein